MTSGDERPAVRLRREPPTFRAVEVRRVEDRSPRLRRLTLAGPELAGLPDALPAASVRLLVPREDGLELPTWEGNEFRFADGTRPPIRTLTPRRIATDGPDPELDVEVVLHGTGALATWTATAAPGAAVAVAGTGRGYEVDPEGRALVLAGDETALPAICQLLEAVPATTAVRVLVEVAEPSGRLELPVHPRADVAWLDLPAGAPPGDALVPAVEALDLDDGGRVWAAGEAAAMQRIRRHLFEQRGLTRSQAVVRGYWKHGRAGDAGET